MADRAERAGGSIYDLGYQRYAGPRLGRRHATWSLYTYSLRVIFGLGRSFWAKASSLGLIAIALLPAIVQLGIASIAPADTDVEVIRPTEYYGLIAPLLAIFIAIVAPDIAGRDQRTHTLSLYFSRAIRRTDYALAKFAALTTALLAMTVIPQLLMFVGNMSAAGDTLQYLEDNWGDVPAIFASAVLLSAFMAGIGLAIACQTPRRMYSTVAIAAVFTLTTGVAAALFEASDPDTGRWALLLSPFHVVQGMTFWIFAEPVGDEEQLAEADFPGVVYAIAAVVLTLVALAVTLRRYSRVQA